MSGGEDIYPPLDHERHQPRLHPDDIKAIADQVLDSGFDRISSNVGKAVLKKLLWIIGMALTGLAIWMAGKGTLDVPK